MLYYAMVFLVIALVAAIFGFTGVYVAAAGIAKILFSSVPGFVPRESSFRKTRSSVTGQKFLRCVQIPAHAERAGLRFFTSAWKNRWDP